MTRCADFHPIEVPELGLPGQQITLSVWLVPIGGKLVRGERVVEIEVGDAIVDLPAPVDGVMATQCVAEENVVTTGQILGKIQAT